MRKVAIIGAGAIGSTLGALLDRAKEQIYLVGRPDHVRAIKENRGLELDGIKGSIMARIQAIETLDFRPDLALLTVKTQDVVSTLEPLRNYLVDVPVLTAQNGIRCDELAASVIEKSNLLSAMMRFTSTYLEPGKVTLIEQGGIVIGKPFSEGRIDPSLFRDLLSKIMPTTVTDNIAGVRWSKLIFNLNNALPAITGHPMQGFSENPGLFRVAVRMMKEGLAVAKAIGVQLEPIPGSPVGLVKLLARLPIGIGASLTRIGFNRAQRRLGDHPLYGSTLQSLMRNRPTEIDYLNGEVVRLGQTVGIETPVNARIVGLVHQVEQTGKFKSPGDLINETEGT